MSKDDNMWSTSIFTAQPHFISFFAAGRFISIQIDVFYC